MVREGGGGEGARMRGRERERERHFLLEIHAQVSVLKEDEKNLDSPVATLSRAVSQWLASKLPQRYSSDWMDVRKGSRRAQ